jgi:class 3 adenylate cyclase
MDTTNQMEQQKADRSRRSTAHVLCVDIVDYSRLSVHDARTGLADLRRAIQESEEFADAFLKREAVLLARDEGLYVLFFNKVLSPISCAIQVTRTYKDNSFVKLRMGIHSGPIFRTGPNRDQIELASEGLLMAQRVMEVGDAGHILLSGGYYDKLGQLMIGYLYLTELGEIQDRRSGAIRIYNVRDVHLGQPQFGNAQVPHKLRLATAARASSPQAATPRAPEPAKRPSFDTLKVALSIAAALLVATILWRITSPTSFARYQSAMTHSVPGSHVPARSSGGPVANVGPVIGAPSVGGSSR